MSVTKLNAGGILLMLAVCFLVWLSRVLPRICYAPENDLNNALNDGLNNNLLCNIMTFRLTFFFTHFSRSKLDLITQQKCVSVLS